ncbi:MAG TPA: polysaccharide biosynthesis tyrosine autokinase [Candidatus Polarisedimenticolaceae bacterium]|nr:polysaccharide biosynthesis tyrosine autokinase [Candidatus Polarisedimenticolaceae bacterium]
MPTPKPITPAAPGREAHLRDYWRVLWQGRYTILAIFLAVVGVTLLRVWFATPIYEAAAVLEIKPEARQILPGQGQWVGAEGGGWLAEEKYFNTQLEVLRSRDVAERTFRQLHLENHPLFKAAKDPVAAFAGLIEIRPKVNTRLVTLKMSGPNPREVRDWVNALADVYVKRNVDEASSSFQAVLDEVERGMKKFRANLGEADLNRMKTAAEAELLVPENQQDTLRQSLGAYNDSLAKQRIEIASIRSEIDGYERARDAKGDVLAVAAVATDPIVQDFVAQRQTAEKELRQIEAEKKPGHPTYLAKLAEIEKINGRIDTQVSAIYDKLKTRLSLAERNESYLEAQIRKTEEDSYRVKQASSTYELQKADAASQRKVYDVVAETMNRLTVGAQLVSMNNNLSILDRATEPRNPVKPRKLLSLGLGGILGLLVGVLAVLFLDYLDNTVRSPEDIEQFLGLGILGIIPRYRDRETPAVREAFQSLRTSILFSSHNREKRVLLLTSAGAQEGKSSTVAMVARALASAGDRVIVVDCDLRRPTQHQHLGVPREPGITNYLVSGAASELDTFVRATDIPTLKVLPCGAIPPNPPELIGSTKFRDLIDMLKRTYDWVLVDSPPVSTLADSVVLASMADMMIMVIKHNQNDRDLIRRSLKRLRDIDVHVGGAVLNSVDLQRTYYGDYYYAGYQYQGETERPRRSRKRQDPPSETRKPGGKVAL